MPLGASARLNLNREGRSEVEDADFASPGLARDFKNQEHQGNSVDSAKQLPARNFRTFDLGHQAYSVKLTSKLSRIPALSDAPPRQTPFRATRLSVRSTRALFDWPFR